MAQDVEQTKLVDAIRTLRVVKLIHKEGSCEVEPHLLAMDWENRAVLVAWLLGHSAQESGWREFLMADISLVQIQNESFFRARPGYDRDGGLKFRGVLARL